MNCANAARKTKTAACSAISVGISMSLRDQVVEKSLKQARYSATSAAQKLPEQTLFSPLI